MALIEFTLEDGEVCIKYAHTLTTYRRQGYMTHLLLTMLESLNEDEEPIQSVCALVEDGDSATTRLFSSFGLEMQHRATEFAFDRIPHKGRVMSADSTQLHDATKAIIEARGRDVTVQVMICLYTCKEALDVASYKEFEKERDKRSFRRPADDREYAILYVKL